MSVRAFQPVDLQRVVLQPAQAWIRPHLTREYSLRLAQDPAFTVTHGDDVIACGGIARWPDARPLLWSLLARDTHGRFWEIHATAKRIIACYDEPQLSATVERSHIAGCRWLELLGFRFELRLAGFGPDGADHDLYVRAA
jgi:hypothetical protein